MSLEARPILIPSEKRRSPERDPRVVFEVNEAGDNLVMTMSGKNAYELALNVVVFYCVMDSRLILWLPGRSRSQDLAAVFAGTKSLTWKCPKMSFRLPVKPSDLAREIHEQALLNRSVYACDPELKEFAAKSSAN